MIVPLRLPVMDVAHNRRLTEDAIDALIVNLPGKPLEIKGGAAGEGKILTAARDGNFINLELEVDDNLEGFIAPALKGDIVLRERSDAKGPKR